jgi:predicted TIM-barrel fold metal-dependent hydrolase
VVFAHFFFLSADLERAAAFLDRWPSVCFDITPGSEMYHNFSKRPAEWREFFVRYQDRILFGTDNTAHTGDQIKWAAQNVERVRGFLETKTAFSGPGLALPQDVLERVYHGTFERVFGATPRPLDMAGLVAYGAVMLEHARAGAGSTESVAILEAVMKKLAGLD